MRRWRRAVVRESCNGHHGHWIARGEPVQEVHLPGVTRVLRRCVQCADEPVPADLPALLDRPWPRPSRSPFMRFAADAADVVDVKMAQAGDVVTRAGRG